MFEVYMTWVDQEGEVPLEGRVFETVNEAINKAQYILSKWYGVTKVAVYREGNLYWSNDSIYSLGERTDICYDMQRIEEEEDEEDEASDRDPRCSVCGSRLDPMGCYSCDNPARY